MKILIIAYTLRIVRDESGIPAKIKGVLKFSTFARLSKKLMLIFSPMPESKVNMGINVAINPSTIEVKPNKTYIVA